MGAFASKRVYISNNRNDTIYIMNDIHIIKKGNQIHDNSCSSYFYKPSPSPTRRINNIPVRTNVANCK